MSEITPVAEVDSAVEVEPVDPAPIEDPEPIPAIPDPADVVRVAAPADDLGKEIFKTQALQARQALAAADIEVANSERRMNDPETTYNEDDHVKVLESRDEKQKILDVIVAATGVDTHDVERDTISGIANMIAEHQGFVSQWTTTRRTHQLMADSPEAFGHNRLDVAWIEQNKKDVETLDAAIAVREGLITQLQVQAAQLKADEKAGQKK